MTASGKVPEYEDESIVRTVQSSRDLLSLQQAQDQPLGLERGLLRQGRGNLHTQLGALLWLRVDVGRG